MKTERWLIKSVRQEGSIAKDEAEVFLLNLSVPSGYSKWTEVALFEYWRHHFYVLEKQQENRKTSRRLCTDYNLTDFTVGGYSVMV